MNRQFAMVVAGFVTTLAVIGGTVAAAQSGVLSTSTTTIQVNGEINVPKTVAHETEAPATATVAPTVEATDTPDIEIITKTEVMPIQYITRTVVVEKRDLAREAQLLAKLNEAYAQMKLRDAAYQAKLQEAYNQLTAAQAAAAAVAPVAAPGTDNNSQSSTTWSQPPAAATEPPARATDPPPAVQPTRPVEHHEEDPKTEVQKPEDKKKP